MRSSTTSTPRMSIVTCLGNIAEWSPTACSLPFDWWPYFEEDCCAMAFSRAMGKLRVIRVSWIVSRDRPGMSKYESWRKACWTSRRRVSSV